jgi:hypothetical protein
MPWTVTYQLNTPGGHALVVESFIDAVEQQRRAEGHDFAMFLALDQQFLHNTSTRQA